MDNNFKIYGPFAIENKQKVYDRECQKAFWSDCVEADEEHFQLSRAKGIYLFSLRNATNYNPQYVGMTERDFRTEVFNSRNMVLILSKFLAEKGVLCLHLLARPREAQRGFSKNISGKELYWTEDFIQQMCRIKNPYFYNIGKSKFLLKTAIEGITDNTISRGEHVQTIRNALGIDDF
jgi:hypothetical protein